MRPLPDRGPLRLQTEAELRLDLHGYDVHTAVELASRCVEAAWEHGFESLTILHGARNVTSPTDAEASGRGAIKWAIRSALADGHFEPWARPPNASEHERASRGSLTRVALRANPDPHPDAEWPVIPQPKHW